MSPVRRVGVLVLCAACAAAPTRSPAAAPADPDVPAAEFGLEDAERLARLLEATAFRPSARELESRYFEPGSPALQRFRVDRLGDAEALRAAIVRDAAGYRRAVRRCLPAAQSLRSRIPGLLAAVERVLGVASAVNRPRVSFLFGAGRSGGTVLGGDVVVALEVVCRFDQDDVEPEALLEAFVVHEAVHAHQLRRQRPEARDSLLRQALIEGYADLVTRKVLDRLPAVQAARSVYGATHEESLWEAFRTDMAGIDLGAWMYGPGPADAPADLGYWLGLRICEAYLARDGDTAYARRMLLDLRDAFEVLARSGYDGSPSL